MNGETPKKRDFFSVKTCVVVISVLLVCRAFAMMTLPLFDPSESRYANISSNMEITGNYLEPQFICDGTLQKFEGKPPLYFQMGGLACKLFGVNEFAVRFPALLSAIGILLIVFCTVKRLRDARTAAVSTVLCALCPVFIVFAGTCMTDLLLCFGITGAVCFYALFSAAQKKSEKKLFSVLFFAMLGVGMITKGPVAIVLAGMPIFFFILVNNLWKDLKNHAWLLGIGVFLLISVPWYWMMQSRNPDFLEYFFINENFKRFLFKEYGDKYGAGRETFKGMSVLFFLACNLPFLLLGLIPSVKKKADIKPVMKRWKEFLADPVVGLPLLLVVTNVFFWALTSRVLITYLLPTIPMTAILIAELLSKSGTLDDEKCGKITVVLAKTVFAAGVITLLALPFFADFLEASPGHFFVKAVSGKEYAGRKVYFMRRTPLCAEFYLRDRVMNHGEESKQDGYDNSRNAILLANTGHVKDFEKKAGKKIGRKIIASTWSWAAYAPEEDAEAASPEANQLEHKLPNKE